MHQTPGKLISEKFDNWKKALGSKGVFEMHAKTEYHKTSQYKYDSFLAVKNNKIQSIEIQVNNALRKEIEENRKRIIPIIKTVLFCGRQGIALRGHKDSGLVTCDEDEIYNDGNFRQLLRFRVDAGDQNLQNHLVTCSKNAMYTSWRIQNEIITACNSLMLQTLVHDINAAKSFTVLADETSDIANKEQLTLCVRYVHFGQKKLREDFLQFIEVKDVSGKALADTILNNLQSMGIETKYLVGQGYDGAASMSGIFNGTQAYIRTKHPMALYIHCSSHCLNLAISSSCKIPDIRNCMGTMQTICNFFSYPKRSNVLLGAIKKLLPDEKSFKLKKFCPTRWVERHDAVILYYELQPAIISALEDISLWKDTDTSSAANQLLASIHQFKFQISMMILVKLFSISVSLSKFLQTENLDLENALFFAETTQTTLKDIRLNADKEFNEIFKSVEKICNTLEIAVCVPRVSGRQTHRTNVDVDTPESFYRVGVFIPFLDNFIEQLHNRFLEHQSILKSFDCLIPKSNLKVTKNVEDKFKLLLENYKDILNDDKNDNILNEYSGCAELKLWHNSFEYQSKLSEHSEQSKITVTDLFFQCNSKMYTIISKLLQIFITLPVTTASGERSFSTLRRIKTYLRNTTGQIRLNGLSMLNIHRDITITPEEIINEMGKTSNKRLALNL
uniref:Zinc finger MYM-type protein 1 n=2 Tax=Melanaphis sacchari TaxID=742174 RepID=A0A2H8TYH1_9HEMI